MKYDDLVKAAGGTSAFFAILAVAMAWSAAWRSSGSRLRPAWESNGEVMQVGAPP